MALRAPPGGCRRPSADCDRELSSCRPRCAGRQVAVKRRQARETDGSTAACSQPVPPSTLTSTASTPPSAQAQPQISTAVPAVRVCSGAGETMTDSGAIAQTGTESPVGCPAPSRTGSLYQRVVNGPDARLSASVSFVSHFTLLVP